MMAILSAGSFLIFFRLEQNLIFHGELGHNYLAIKNFIAEGKIPLLGPPTSHPWLSFGPLFYWIFAPILALWRFNPVAGGYFFASIFVILITANYFVVKKLVEAKTALISSALISVSPVYIGLFRGARFFSLVALLFYPFVYFLVKKKRFLSGIFYGLILNFHYTPLVYAPALSLIFFREKSLKKSFLTFSAGALIPQIPFLLHNFLTGFDMIAKFAAWIPYRVAGAAGLYPKNNLTAEVLYSNIGSFEQFLSRSFGLPLPVAATALFLLFSVFLYWRSKSYFLKTLALFLVFGYIGIFIHGDPPDHYYLPLYPIPIILVSWLLSRGARSGRGRALLASAVTALVINNFVAGLGFESSVVPFGTQLSTARRVIEEAKGEGYSLTREGPYDHFEGDFAQNYQYLLWWMGREPEAVGEVKTELFFEIIENGEDVVIKAQRR